MVNIIWNIVTSWTKKSSTLFEYLTHNSTHYNTIHVHVAPYDMIKFHNKPSTFCISFVWKTWLIFNTDCHYNLFSFYSNMMLYGNLNHGLHQSFKMITVAFRVTNCNNIPGLCPLQYCIKVVSQIQMIVYYNSKRWYLSQSKIDEWCIIRSACCG